MDESFPINQSTLSKPAERILLLVDDEPNVLNALGRVLRPDGYQILRAESGEAAIHLLENSKVGVIVSDQRMPGMSGVEFLHCAKQLHPNTVRMVLSGYTDLKSVTDAINEGAVYKFLTKPWEDDQLRASIREAFGHYELRAENTRLAEELAAAYENLARAKGRLEVEVEHNVEVLKVSQEMLEHLPVGALGIDQEGIVAVANRKALEILAGDPPCPLVGSLAAECLPAVMIESLTQVNSRHAPIGGTWRSPHADDFEFSCQLMGLSSHSHGVLLTLIPAARRTA